MSIDKCIKTIIDETGTNLTKEEVGKVLEMIVAYETHPRNRKVFGPFSPEHERVTTAIENPTTAKMVEARDILLARAKLIEAQQRANVLRDAEKRVERQITYSHAPDVSMGIQAKLVGTNTPFLGSRDSVAAAIEGNMHQIIGRFDQELKTVGLDKVYASRSLETLWAKELYELNRDGGRPGITGNKQALTIAEKIRDLQKASVELLNREGAFIGQYDGYISRTSHSTHMLRKMGVDRWVALAKQHFDLDTIYPNRDAAFIDDALRKQFARIESGLHDNYDPAELDIMHYSPGQNLAKRLSESRVIHFKSADDWLAYMHAASELTPTQAVFMSAQRATRDAALMRHFGTNPKAALEKDILLARQAARDSGNFALSQKLDEQSRHYELWMSHFTGEATTIKNRTWAAITQNTLAIQRMAKLGFLPFAQLSDIASLTGELRYQGVSFFDSISAGVFSYFRGGLNSDKRQIADLLNAYMEGELSQYGMLMETNDPRISGTFTGRINQLQEWFFKYTGATAMTNRSRGSLMYMMARHMGQYHMKDFSSLGEAERRIMRAFNIEREEWRALARANWTTGVEGKRYLTPRDAMSIPDSAIDTYNINTGNSFEYSAFRDEIARRLYSYYADRMDYGVLQPGVAERAILYQGKAADTGLGMALRLAFQFKSFMIAQLRRTWGRELYGQGSKLGAVAGLVNYAVQGTILGIMANGLNQIFKGQDPTSQFEEFPTQAVLAGFMRAGSASIMGDFLFSDFSRHGNSIASYALGPTGGNVEVFAKIYSKMVRGENPSGDVIRFGKSMTPFVNSFYTKMAADYLVWNGLTEAANPGYLKRLERRQRKQQGIRYWREPVNTSPAQFRAF